MQVAPTYSASHFVGNGFIRSAKNGMHKCIPYIHIRTLYKEERQEQALRPTL